MPFDNNGIFKLIYNWTNEKNAGRDLISAGKMDEQTEDMADALTKLYGSEYVSTPKVTTPIAIAVGMSSTMTLKSATTAKDATITKFIVNIDSGADIDVAAAGGAANYTFTPEGEAGKEIYIQAVAVDSSGHRSRIGVPETLPVIVEQSVLAPVLTGVTEGQSGVSQMPTITAGAFVTTPEGVDTPRATGNFYYAFKRGDIIVESKTVTFPSTGGTFKPSSNLDRETVYTVDAHWIGAVLDIGNDARLTFTTTAAAPMPMLSGATGGNERTAIAVNVTDHVSGDTYTVDTAGFGSASVNGAVITWTLGSIQTSSAQKVLKVARNRAGVIRSEQVSWTITVTDVPVDWDNWDGSRDGAFYSTAGVHGLGAVAVLNENLFVCNGVNRKTTGGISNYFSAFSIKGLDTSFLCSLMSENYGSQYLTIAKNGPHAFSALSINKPSEKDGKDSTLYYNECTVESTGNEHRIVLNKKTIIGTTADLPGASSGSSNDIAPVGLIRVNGGSIGIARRIVCNAYTEPHFRSSSIDIYNCAKNTRLNVFSSDSGNVGSNPMILCIDNNKFLCLYSTSSSMNAGAVVSVYSFDGVSVSLVKQNSMSFGSYLSCVVGMYLVSVVSDGEYKLCSSYINNTGIVNRYSSFISVGNVNVVGIMTLSGNNFILFIDESDSTFACLYRLNSGTITFVRKKLFSTFNMGFSYAPVSYSMINSSRFVVCNSYWVDRIAKVKIINGAGA